MANFAGRYDELLLRNVRGRLTTAHDSTVMVYESDGTTVATLYTDRTKATTAANPVEVDANGNLEFFAEPGIYVLSIREDGTVVATNTVTVGPDHDDIAAVNAVLNSDTSTAAMGFVVDEDDMVSNSATKLPTQQSVKAYVDTATSGIFLPPGRLYAAVGAPVLSTLNDWVDGWLMDAAADEAVNASAVETPSTWATFDIDVIWANAGAGTGDVVFLPYWTQANAGQAIPQTTQTLDGPVTATAGAQAVVTVTRLTSGHTRSATYQSFQLYRNGSAAGDTLANDIAILGVKLTRAS